MIANRNISLVFIGLIGVFTSIFFATPTKEHFEWLESKEGINSEIVQAYYVKKGDLLNNMRQFPEFSHAAKTTFRLTVPFIMKVFNLEIIEVYYLQILLGILTYVLLSFIIYHLTNNYKTTLLFVVASSCTYFGRAYFIDNHPMGDTFAFFFALCAILWRKVPLILFVSAIGLFFTDERGALMVLLVLLLIKISGKANPGDIRLKDFFSLQDNSSYLLLGFGVSLGLRLFLGIYHDMSVPTSGGVVGPAVFFLQWKWIQKGLFSGFGSFWGLIALSVAVSLLKKEKLLCILFILCSLGFMLVSVFVYDITRSIAYLFPLTFVCLKHLKANTMEINKILFVIVVVNFFIPTSVVKGTMPDEFYYPYIFNFLFDAGNYIHAVLH